MKKISLIIIGAALSFSIYSQAPQSFSYQAILRNADGTILINENVSMQIDILKESIDGEAVFTEIHNVSTNATGLVNLEIGSGIGSDDITSIDWRKGPFFLNITVNGINLGASQLLSVPYAMHATSAERISGNISDSETDPVFLNSQAYYISNSDISNLSNLSGINTGDQDLSGKVDVVMGKGLSTNDYTTEEKTKLEGISNGAEVNVNPDWNATSGPSQILNKPTLIGYGNEADPIFSSWDKSTGINLTSSQISDFQASVTDISEALTNGSETKILAGTDISVSGTGTSENPYIVNSTRGGEVFTHYIGELFGGGIVVAVWKEGGVEKGLIASLDNMKTSANTYLIPWSVNNTTLIGVGAQSAFDGQANTSAIVAQSDTSERAAVICDEYIITDNTGTYSDWYLPSVWELNQCYDAAFIVNSILGALNGFQFDYYWSSTETIGNYVGFQYFDYGSTYYDNKTSAYWVRAVRRF